MHGDFRKRTRTRPDGEPCNEGTGLRRLPTLAWRLERAFCHPIAMAHIGHDLLERRGLAFGLLSGKDLSKKILLPHYPAIGLTAVEHVRMPVANAGLDKSGKALPGGTEPLPEVSQHPIRCQPRLVFFPKVSAVTTPDIGTRCPDHLRSDRVQMQVAHQRQAITILIDKERVEAPLKHVPDLSAPGIEIAGVSKRKVLHAGGQLNVTDLQNEVQVIGHQAEGMNPVAEADNAFRKQVVEILSVVTGEEHILPSIAAQNDVVQTTGNMQSGFASHGTEDT